MKKRALKALFAGIALSATVCFSAVFGGCFATAGRDGKDGKDLNIYDIYEALKTETGNSDLTFSDFVKDYLGYTPAELDEKLSLQASINRSLMASVSIIAGFRESAVSTSLKTYSGSGVIIDADEDSGDFTVLTNCHVVYSAQASLISGQDGYSDNVAVWLYGSEYSDSGRLSATIMATSKSYDIALLKVSGGEAGKRVKTADWVSGEETYLGETVYAIGNAGGEKMCANTGIISKDIQTVKVNLGTDRSTELYEYQVLRTSAPINSGNSGGGLFNVAGELVGLVNSKSGSSEMTGVGYALTASSTKRVVKRMLNEYDGYEFHDIKTVDHHVLLRTEEGYTTGLNDKGFAEIREDVVVASVLSGKFAGKLLMGDTITNVKIERNVNGSNVIIEDVEIKRTHNFNDVMLAVEPNDTVTVTVSRGENISVVFTESDFSKKDR